MIKKLVRLAAIALVLSMCVVTSRGWSHGDATWIMQNPSTSYCCGPNDCARIPKEAVKILASGYGVTVNGQAIVVPYGKELKSEDDDFWGCIPPGGTMRCFFAPPLGT